MSYHHRRNSGLTFVIWSALCMALIIVIVILQSRKPDSGISQPGSSLKGAISDSAQTDQFAGSHTCFDCHAEESKAWESHPMFLSTRRISDRTEDEDFLTCEFSPAENLTYRIEQRGAEMFHHEIMTDISGQPIYDQSEQVHFVIGSGQQGHAYLIQRAGLLFASPVNWYSRTGKWGLAPGYNPKAHNRFERRVTDGCVNCHAGRAANDSKTADHFHEPVFHEMGIGCERCHGPAKDHVAHHMNLQSPDHIVNPSKLDFAQRDAVCNQCHLQGLERVLRYGRSEFDFRPGQRLSDVWTIFVQDARNSTSSARAVSHVEQMLASHCYVQSNGSMGCISCHDPHSASHGQQSRDLYRASCLKCHMTKGCTENDLARAAKSDSCMDCHMPANSASDVPHAAHTDHRILRRPSEQTTSSRVLSTDAVMIFPEVGAAPLSDDESARARGIAFARLAERGELRETGARAETLLRQAQTRFSDDPVLLEWLGTSLELQGRSFEASVIWKKGLNNNPRSESILFRLAKLSHDSGDLPAAILYLEEFLKLNPWHAGIHGRHAHVLGLQGRIEEGIRAAETALGLDPSLIQVRGWLIEAYRTTGQPDLQREQQELFDRMVPITGLPEEPGRRK